MAWVAPIIGIWTIITPWVIRGGIASTATTGTIASNVAVGAVALVAGLAAMSVGTLSRR
jgi:TRAP-type C4-dicarboxylate transport system permease large subunit